MRQDKGLHPDVRELQMLDVLREQALSASMVASDQYNVRSFSPWLDEKGEYNQIASWTLE